ncbi:nitroreductase family protein [Bacteroides intestinalis]|jgi:nitroreductase|uniref:nitroreductase family protein n=1 Tax=Bacteroides intestinalis TaxID=329854 RepID=UPI0022E42A15|nr:nitroreductase family protein [Bacteroides intestinalis]
MGVLYKCKYLYYRLKCLYDDWRYINLFYDGVGENLDVALALLRKNCHILDKGLHIIPFEKGHGKRVYNEALFLQNRLVNTNKESDLSFVWCKKIILSYEQAQNIGRVNTNNSFYNYNDIEKQWIYDFFHSRISCRNFNNKPVDDSIWNEIIELAADAPTGCCRQTSRVYVVCDEKTINSLVPNIGGATGFSKIPYLLCVTADVRPYTCIDRMLPYIDAALFVENLVLACRANNIFTTILNFQHASKKERNHVMRCLGIPLYERVVLFIAAGYVNSVPVKPIRMSVEQFRKM